MLSWEMQEESLKTDDFVVVESPEVTQEEE